MEWEVTPIQPERRAEGLVFQMESPADEPRWGELNVFRLEPRAPGAPGVPGAESTTRRSIEQILGEPPFKYRNFKRRLVSVDEGLQIDQVAARHLRWSVGWSWIDTWTLHLPDFDVCLVFVVHREDERADSWLRLFARSARSFERVEFSRRRVLEDAQDYAGILAFYQAQAARTPGWQAIATPAEKFVVKTNSSNRRFIRAAIERLERSRELFEQDFPPPAEFDHVSVVRICDTEEEFHRYGGTGGGIAGWFNPATTELVLYDAVAIDRNMTFAVMGHGAFHQYCYFLFGRSEAHRWFDEGHGDYYGSFEFKGGRAQVTARMPGGLERLMGIREMIRDETYAPLREHLNFDHREWQGQGPTNVSPYQQSWSLIYMLRQGSLGLLPRKLWRPEYGDVLDDYVRTLHAGFARAYLDQVDELWIASEERGRVPSAEELHAARNEVSDERKQRIWALAMESSWGRIDLEQFEQHWLLYVSKYLKD